jgi:hypothetical protein
MPDMITRCDRSSFDVGLSRERGGREWRPPEGFKLLKLSARSSKTKQHRPGLLGIPPLLRLVHRESLEVVGRSMG